MLSSADEFIALLDSENVVVNKAAISVTASEQIWLEIIGLYPEVKTMVAGNKTIPDSIIYLLAHDSNRMVRWEIANKRKTDPQLLLELAKDVEPSVRERVVYNAKSPLFVLELLKDDEVSEIAQVAQKRIRERSYRN